MKTALGIKSEILVPLLVEGNLRGVVLASSSTPEHFAEEAFSRSGDALDWRRHPSCGTDGAAHPGCDGSLAAEEILTLLAHDLGNMLAPLKGRLDLLERRARREGQFGLERELLIISQGVMRLHRLVTDLLDVTRLREGLFALQRHAFDLVEVLQSVVPLWSTAEHPIELHAPDHLSVVADQNRIQQALENLFSNATTHADPGTVVQVTVSEEPHREGPWVAVTISNQGPPIPPDLLATLFLPFAKGAQSQGMGLGLYLAERIAHAHQGRLIVHTAAPATTSFVLSWPRAPSDGAGEYPLSG